MAGIAASRTYTGSGTWFSPPGYKGPILACGGNFSSIFVVEPATSYAVEPGGGTFGGGSIGGSGFSSMTITWWPTNVSHRSVTNGDLSWTAPPGYKGPVFVGSTTGGVAFTSGTFGINTVWVTQYKTLIGYVEPGATYLVSSAPAATAYIVWWP